MSERRKRMDSMSIEILGCCVDQDSLKEDGVLYLQDNGDLALDVINILDGIKDKIQRILKMNLRNVSDAAVDPPSDDEDGIIKELDANVHQAAITILGEATCNGYNRIEKKISVISKQKLPSYYILTKDRPDIVPLSFPLSEYDNNCTV
mgnify:CR=1 FL=1